MQIFVALLAALAAFYFWDVQYNQGKLSDGLTHMRQSMLHGMGH